MSGGETAVGVALVLIAMLCVLAGALMLTVDGAPEAVRSSAS